MMQYNKILIFGLGGAGTRVIRALIRSEIDNNIMLYALDTDAAALTQAGEIPESQRILMDEQWLSGLGTGGDIMKGQRAMTRESNRLCELMQNASMLIVTGGLGGGTATGGAAVLARLAGSMNLPTVFMLELPFAFEGPGRHRNAEDGLRELLTLSDTVLSIPNDLLFSVLPPETPFADAFRMADRELARTISGVIAMLRPGNMLSADLGDLSNILKKRKSYAAVGVGNGEDPNAGAACRQALASLVDSPFLGGSTKLKDADAVIINLTGGSNLTLSEVKRTLETAGTLPGLSARLMVGANIDESFQNRVQLTAIAIKYDEREAADLKQTEQLKPQRKASKRKTAKDENSEQPTLGLQFASCGIFEGYTETIINGVNFDRPTFSRRDMDIDTGE